MWRDQVESVGAMVVLPIPAGSASFFWVVDTDLEKSDVCLGMTWKEGLRQRRFADCPARRANVAGIVNIVGEALQ